MSTPNLPQTLINEPGQGNPANPSDLGPLQHLLGTWTNQNLGNSGKGDYQNPYSYNVMPLPQSGGDAGKDGYILKNFSYYEEITFSQIHGNAPNRGGTGTQVANTIFYEQRVYFAEGPYAGQLVHAENGSWLYLTDRAQFDGPYGLPMGGPTNILKGSSAPTQPFNLVKQMSVPHGNSILAGGNYTNTAPIQGSPTIPAVSVLPTSPAVNTTPYSTLLDQDSNYQNPNLNLTKDPNAVLNSALSEGSAVSSYIPFSVSTNTSNVPVTNIPFEERVANVTAYSADYWLESLDGTNFNQLQYSQNITMMMLVNGQQYMFPHVTTNTLTRA